MLSSIHRELRHIVVHPAQIAKALRGRVEQAVQPSFSLQLSTDLRGAQSQAGRNLKNWQGALHYAQKITIRDLTANT
jgi:hypothetical protein